MMLNKRRATKALAFVFMIHSKSPPSMFHIPLATLLLHMHYAQCTMQVKISLYIGYLVFVLFIWIQLYSGWLVFGAHFATVGLRIVRWTFQVYCARVVYLEHIVQEVAHERRRVLVGACYVDHRVTGRQEACKGGSFFRTMLQIYFHSAFTFILSFDLRQTPYSLFVRFNSNLCSQGLLCRPSGHGQTGGVQRRILF